MQDNENKKSIKLLTDKQGSVGKQAAHSSILRQQHTLFLEKKNPDEKEIEK
jgi:hypothetical protein